MTADFQEISTFWFDEVGPEGWFRNDPALDARIRDQFMVTWESGVAGALDAWSVGPRQCLALIVLLDQFPRNMFRDDPRAFSSDRKALGFAKAALGRGFDRRVEAGARQTFFLPLMHSENVEDQERSVRLHAMAFGPGELLIHAQAHRAVIRRFGRFPFRNAVLGRKTTGTEAEWLAEGGYGAALREFA